jgi:hypothetical protein
MECWSYVLQLFALIRVHSRLVLWCVFVLRLIQPGRSAFKAGRGDSLNVKPLERQKNE